MTETKLRAQMKRIEKIIKNLDDEALVWALEQMQQEMEYRSQEYMKGKS